jgi:MFS family permease
MGPSDVVLVSGSFIPAIPQIVRDLDSTPAVVTYVPVVSRQMRTLIDIEHSLAVTLSIFGHAVGNLWWSTYCAFCECSFASFHRVLLGPNLHSFTPSLSSILSGTTISKLITLTPDGRRPIYLFSLPTLCIASLGVTFARSVPALLIWRVVQAFGCSSGFSVGAAAIGDIYRLEERGTAMGIFFGVRRLLLSRVKVR